ncbi:hypothetical protein FRB98_000983 [Tulasnella sp. 332]|nr:hypothetical protein FRB98_000983 [Tulasnella sp. 332]
MVYYEPSSNEQVAQAQRTMDTEAKTEMNTTSPIVEFQPGQAAAILKKMESDENQGLCCSRYCDCGDCASEEGCWCWA